MPEPVDGSRGTPDTPSPSEERPIESRELAILCARVADEKKGQDIVILDVEERIQITDYFVIVTGMNRKQLRTIAEEIRVRLKREGYLTQSLESDNLDSWVCLDYGDVIVHLFQEEARRYYDLEFLWSDAPRVEWHLASA